MFAFILKFAVEDFAQVIIYSIIVTAHAQDSRGGWARLAGLIQSLGFCLLKLHEISVMTRDQRETQTQLPVPPTWCDLLEVPLAAGPERAEVETAFFRTLDRRNIQVHEVVRRQHKAKWKLFSSFRRNILERDAGAAGANDERCNLWRSGLHRSSANASALARCVRRCERRWLFYGTDEVSAKEITEQGFDRVKHGKNMTMYGKGVYFARDSRFAANPQYSVPNAQGMQYVFLCRVVVGEYCEGVKDAATPPVRYDTVRFDSTVDDVVNPSIYVTFHDSQAYPEYLVKFMCVDANLGTYTSV